MQRSFKVIYCLVVFFFFFIPTLLQQCYWVLLVQHSCPNVFTAFTFRAGEGALFQSPLALPQQDEETVVGFALCLADAKQ